MSDGLGEQTAQLGLGLFIPSSEFLNREVVRFSWIPMRSHLVITRLHFEPFEPFDTGKDCFGVYYVGTIDVLCLRAAYCKRLWDTSCNHTGSDIPYP